MRRAHALLMLIVLGLPFTACAPRLSVFSLPPNPSISAPDAGVSGRAALLSGAWSGTWLTPGWGPGYDGLLIVERIEGDQASILYAWGKLEPQAERGWYRQKARIGEGASLEWTRGEWSFQFQPQPAGKTLTASVRGKSVDSVAVADFRPVDPRKLGPVIPAATHPAPVLPPVPPLATVPPAPDLPPALSGFWGHWEGTWDSGVASRLVVTEVNRGAARVIYTWSDDPKGSFKGGEMTPLALTYPGQRKITWGGRPAFTFRLRPDGRELEGEWEEDGRLSFVLMKRVSP